MLTNPTKLTIALVLAFLSTAVVHAETYSYSCNACVFPSIPNGGDGCDVDGTTYPLRVDDKQNVLEWRGKKYNLTIATADEPNGCAKYGWHAKGNGTSFTFCTATQGYGAIEDKTEMSESDAILKGRDGSALERPTRDFSALKN
jgi:hypothetical protein